MIAGILISEKIAIMSLDTVTNKLDLSISTVRAEFPVTHCDLLVQIKRTNNAKHSQKIALLPYMKFFLAFYFYDTGRITNF